MSQQVQDKVKVTVNGHGYTVSEISELTGLTEKTVKSTPKAALEGLVQAQVDKAKAESKASTQRKPKETPREKFLKKAQGKMGAGVEKLVDHLVNGTVYDKENDYTTTDQYMADNYGPVVLSVLYKYGCLSKFMNKRIESLYPDS